MKINSVAYVIDGLLANKKPRRNFPKSLSFPLQQAYVDLVNQIDTTEISSECTLLNGILAHNETTAYSATDYWEKGYTSAQITNFWIFGQNAQGDLWLFDRNNKVYFYDHNQGEMSKANFRDLGLNFESWLQFADLNRQLDDIFDQKEDLSADDRMDYRQKLNEISYQLLIDHPFEI